MEILYQITQSSYELVAQNFNFNCYLIQKKLEPLFELGVTSTRSPGCEALEIHMCTTHMCIARRRARTSRVSRLHYYIAPVRTAGPGPKTIPARAVYTCHVSTRPLRRDSGRAACRSACCSADAAVLSTQSARQPRAQYFRQYLASLKKKSKNSAFQMSS